MAKMQNNQKQIPVFDICLMGIFVALIAVFSQIAIPLPLGVPLALQTLAVMLAASVLGAKKALIVVTVWLALGAFGVPVFTWAGGAGGLHRIVGLWGGFLMSYPFVALAVGSLGRSGKRTLLAIGLLAGIIINLSLGTLWHYFVSDGTLQASFLAAFAPFVIVEPVKAAGVLAIAPEIRRALARISRTRAA
ncbi:MAG: biotin transporter BioY [Oscillospiraceae bacterium]|nr:biotin transporter BioY [Oscillospiraceae bacterium]